MKTICVFYDINKKKINLEIEISQVKNDIVISCLNKLDFYYCPVYHKTGIYLEKISFPFYLPILNNIVLLPWFYDELDYQKAFDDFILDKILIYCLNHNLNLVLSNKELELVIKKKYSVMLSNIIENKFNNIEAIINGYKNIGCYYNYLIKKNYIEVNINKFYCGTNSIDTENGYVYHKNYYMKVQKSSIKFYPENPDKKIYQFYYLKNQNFISNLIELISTDNLINNLKNLLSNLEETGLYFKFVLFIASNNFKILKDDNGIYKEILNVINELKETKLILDLNNIETHQINNLISFLKKYPIFIKDYLKRIIKQVNFTLNYFKRDLDINFLKFCLIYFGVFEFINFNIINLVNFKIKCQFGFLIDEISEYLKFKKIGFVNNEKFYQDPNYRLVIKYFILNNKCEIRNKNSFDKKIINSIKKYSFYREYLYDSKWNNILTNFILIKQMGNDRNILLYKNKLNKIIFTKQNFKSISFILNYKFYLVSLLETKEEIKQYLFYNIKNINELFSCSLNESLSSYQIKQLAYILYLLKFVESINLEDENYLNFIIQSQKIKNILIVNNIFTLKIKEMGFSSKLNLGVITKNILTYKTIQKTMDPSILLKKYKFAYYYYRKKYTKYKTKYYLSKFKNNKLFTLKNLKN